MNKFLILGMYFSASLCAWEDHPDRDEDRRSELSESQCHVESGYDWSKRDQDSKDNDSSSAGDTDRGTMLSGPDRDK